MIDCITETVGIGLIDDPFEILNEHFGPADRDFHHHCFFANGKIVTKVLVGGCNFGMNWACALWSLVKAHINVGMKEVCSACGFGMTLVRHCNFKIRIFRFWHAW